jgi:alpha-tubulin suppressor-like RCC1 family protein
MKWSNCFHFLHMLLLLIILAVFCIVPLLSPFSLAAVPDPNKLWIWGANYTDQLDNGSTNNSNIPLQMSGLDEVVSIAAGDTHVLALKSDGTVWAWGTNVCGELGDGTNNNSNIPVQVSGLTGVVAIAASSG